MRLAPLTLVRLAACSGGASDDTASPTGEDDTGASGGVDNDGDGYGADDCDDTDEAINPGADELCDGIDNDCDAEIDEDAVDGTTWFNDGTWLTSGATHELYVRAP